MIRKLLTYLIFPFAVMFVACDSERIDYVDNQNRNNEGSSIITLGVRVGTDNAVLRSRDVDMSQGSTVSIDSIWIGVYEISTGNRLGQALNKGYYRNVNSGDTMLDVVPVTIEYATTPPQVYIVGVANFDDIYVGSGRTDSDRLSTHLLNADSWSKLINISVDGESAYSDPHNYTSPLIMGYFFKGDNYTRATNAKVDQSNTSQGCSVTSDLSSHMTVSLTGGNYTDEDGNVITSNKYYVPSGTLQLRRLVSNINVNVVPGDGLEITGLQYRRYNMPKAVYLAERRLIENNNSTNYADTNPLELYYSDLEEDGWISANGGTSFSFQHFENKHWGKSGLGDYSSREKIAEGKFAALNDGADQYASYFKISMHVLDRAKGKSADVVYTIHEGYCNDIDGNASKNNVRDFQCVRNTNYNYNIKVNGLSGIELNVSGSGEHRDDQTGEIWQMIYPEGVTDAGVNFNGATITKGLNFSEINEEELAFRIYWCNEDGEILDYCYNFDPIEDFTQKLTSFWPSFSQFTATVQDIENHGIPEDLLNAIKIYDGAASNGLSIVDFVQQAVAGQEYGYVFDKYELDPDKVTNVYNHPRGIFIFDRKQLVNGLSDSDGCFVHSLFGAIQYADPTTLKFQLLPLNTLPTVTATIKNFIDKGVDLDFTSSDAASGNREFAGHYYYKLTYKSNSWDISTSNLVFTIPVSILIVGKNSFDYSIQTVSDESNYLVSEIVSSTGSYITVENPSTWDFTSKDFTTWASSNMPINGTWYTASGDKTWNYNSIGISLANSKQVRGTSGALEFNNSGDANNVYFTVYRSCKLTVSIKGNSGGVFHVKGSDGSDQTQSAPTSKTSYTFNLTASTDGTKYTLYFASQKGAFYSVKLSSL